MLTYEPLSAAMTARIERDRRDGTVPPLAFDNDAAVRRDPAHDRASLLRPPFVRDIDKILHCPYYNRYADKTQVFSFYKNDDITRRSLHVQFVSRIARTIGSALGLNLDLIEAIALGHDIGHTPCGHAGESILDELLYAHTGRHFSHNIHSVRVLDRIYPYNITLQTLSGIAAHDGELELAEYRPHPMTDFDEFDRAIEACYADRAQVKRLVPSTLEGCVMRVSDIIAYLGKDRQDAARAGIGTAEFESGRIGRHNAEIIHNLMVNIVENSYGKPYIRMDEEHFAALKKAKADNYALIYKSEQVERDYEAIRPMMTALYERLLDDLVAHRVDSPIYTHHIAYVNAAHYRRSQPYEQTEQNQIVVDYIASMTDDYLVDLYARLFPDSPLQVQYKGYF